MPYGWNIASRQAGTENPQKVRDNNPLSLLQQGQEYATHSWTFLHKVNKLIAHSTLS